MRPIAAAIAAAAMLLLTHPATVAAQSDLERARVHYNAGEFDASIAAATAAKSKSGSGPSATLIAARARLERFRRNSDENDLTAARKDLISLNPHMLSPQEAVEWQIGLGTALFLENQPGAAAETFFSVIPAGRERLSAPEFAKLFEWWASTAARVAESLGADARKVAYSALQKAVRDELTRNSLSRPASYWLAVAARGAGDVDGAWSAAVAGWVRAGSEAEGQQLRADLDRFVTQTLIPERAQSRSGQRLDAKVTLTEIATMTDEWRAITSRWN